MPQLQTGYIPLRPHVTSNTDLWDILERKGALCYPGCYAIFKAKLLASGRNRDRILITLGLLASHLELKNQKRNKMKTNKSSNN